MSLPPDSDSQKQTGQPAAAAGDACAAGMSDAAVRHGEAAFAAEEQALQLQWARQRRLHLRIGAAFLALLLLVFGLLSVDNLTDFFEKDSFLVEAYYDDIGDLRPGAPVYLGGVQIGKVTAYDLGEDGRVRVRAALHLRKPLPVDSQMNIDATTVSGDTFVSLVRGSSPEVIQEKGRGAIPVFRGSGFFNVSDIGALAADIGALAAGLGKNFAMFRDEKSPFVMNVHELKKNGRLAKEEYELFQQRMRKTRGAVEQASKSFSKTSLQVTGLDVRLDVGGLPKKVPGLQEQYKQINANLATLAPAIDAAKKDLPAIMAQWKELGRKIGGIQLKPHSLVGAITTPQCEGIPATVGLFQDAVARVSDYSLMKKLKYYFTAKDLYESFEKQTPLTLQLDAQELYRSWVQFARIRKAGLLPRYPTACPLPAELR